MKGLVKEGSIALLVLASAFTFTVSHAMEGDLNCVLSDQDHGDAKASFSTTADAVYLNCTSKALHKGQKVTATLIAADTHKAAPDNFQVGTKTNDIPEKPEGGTTNIDYSFTKPNNGWPAGSYHVDLFVDDSATAIVSFPFTVQ